MSVGDHQEREVNPEDQKLAAVITEHHPLIGGGRQIIAEGDPLIKNMSVKDVHLEEEAMNHHRKHQQTLIHLVKLITYQKQKSCQVNKKLKSLVKFHLFGLLKLRRLN